MLTVQLTKKEVEMIGEGMKALEALEEWDGHLAVWLKLHKDDYATIQSILSKLSTAKE